MRRRKWRGHLSSADQAELWRRWRQGEPLNAIARALDRRRSVVQRVLAGTGCFTPVPRRRSRRVLSLAEREEISRGVAVGHSVRQIAGRLGRAPSTVCRELGRHGGRTRYRAATADAAAWQLARRPHVCKLAAVPRLRTLGGGANVLDSPLLALAYLVETLGKQARFAPVQAGEIVTTGTLTAARPVSLG